MIEAKMNIVSRAIFAAVVAVPLAGCASRAAPFDKLNDASMTILRLQGQAPPPNPLQPQPGGIPMIPIPGLTPEQQQQLQTGLQQGAQQLQQLIPGMPPIFPGQAPPAQGQPAQQLYNGFAVGGVGYGDDDLKDEILDLLGDADSFGQNAGQCFTPGMAFIFQPVDGSPSVEVMVSLSCNRAAGNQWPYQVNGLTPDSANKLRNIYFKAFQQPPPPSGA